MRGSGGGQQLGVWAAGLAAIYSLTLRPTIGWSDTPELVTVAYTLGIAHPPGTPTYALLGKLFSLIPLGSIAVRLNLFSAVCAVAAAALLAWSVARLHVRMGGQARSGQIVGLGCATLLALAPTYWSYATQTEVYAPFVLTVALLVALALRWEETGDTRWLLGGSLLFGLSGGIHGTAIFFAPALVFIVLKGVPWVRLPRTLAWILLFAVLGASVYLYLPIRAATEPTFNWGDPDTLVRFWSHVSDRKDSEILFATGKFWWPYVKVFARNLDSELTATGWVFGLLGLLLAFRRAPGLATFTLLFCLGNLLFFLRIWTIPDAYLPTFWFFMLWAGVGMAGLIDSRLLQPRRARVLVTILLVVAIASQVGHALPWVGARAHGGGRSAAEANLLPLPPNALVLVTSQWFPFRYLQDVEGMRPDVTILLVSDLLEPEHFTPVTSKRFPRIVVPERTEETERWDAYFQVLLRENLGKSPVFWEPMSELDQHVYQYLRPWRYLWRFEPNPVGDLERAEVDSYFEDLRGFLGKEFSVRGVMEDPEGARHHAYLLAASGGILKLRKRPQDALVLVELASRLKTDDAVLANELAGIYSGFGRWTEAERLYRRASELDPAEPSLLLNLAKLQMHLGRLTEAEATIRSALRNHAGAPEPHYQLYELEKKKQRPGAARDALQAAIDRARNEGDRARWRGALAALGAGEKS
ncbi:MAG: DUF2723 domain-containing protein [Deltaproteobacteria bacterium]|nr:DUF2723 domain-containing protein [Deltaproteobacteria bacterium]